VGFSNDPFTPAQSWMDSENVVATLMPNGDTVIKAERNTLRLEDRLPIPVTRETRIAKQEEVNNRWVLGVDRKDRDGVYGGYGEKIANLRAILAREVILPDELVMIVDGVDDWDAANTIGCRFIGVPDGTLDSVSYDGPLVGDFDDLWLHLRNRSHEH
jgi:phosphoglycolate phosphatase-like HAD superfamily hydrolase